MLEESFARQRLCLNVLSIALVAYYAVGLEFVREGVLLGALDIRVEREGVAFAMVWITFFYFWWRFQVYGADARRRWKMDFLFQLSQSRKYLALFRQPVSDDQSESTVWVPALHGEGFRRYLAWDEAYLIGVRSGDGRIQFADPSTFGDSINPLTQKWDVGPDTVIPLKWRKYLVPSLKATLSAMRTRNGTQWVLPNLLACLALTCGISSLVVKLVAM